MSKTYETKKEVFADIPIRKAICFGGCGQKFSLGRLLGGKCSACRKKEKEEKKST